MPKSKAYIGHLMILATTFIYSFNTNFMKVIIPEWIGPNGLVLLRCSASTLVFWLIGLYFPTSSDRPHPQKKEIGMMILGGILGLGGNLLFYINGLSQTGPIDAFVIRTTQPIIVIARLFFCIPYLPNTKPSVFYSVLQAPFMPPLCPTPEAW